MQPYYYQLIFGLKIFPVLKKKSGFKHLKNKLTHCKTTKKITYVFLQQ